eukprot:CAMPEP_0170357518 /NCGR_PEP_ID=MMETSP0117_2-20130122/1751_1 /TAXON_ID=400756 /ORGANISM="Durinskia baltica, Strain CSIRO CS-38" /LENGTH=218 /DNA_ID=CAMNT_0010611693 /DNA_START=117 /DNA_END=773 /DNA_ORIENTATION=+
MSSAAHAAVVDAEYPGTAVERMLNVQQRVRSLSPAELNGDWNEVRRRLLWAGGLRDLTSAMPGRGYTGHSFNDFNHCDLTTMRDDVVGLDNNGQVEYVAVNNPLGEGIRIASLPELGPGGSWTTCMMGCHHPTPRDVAHVQFRSRIAFKLVWAPPIFTSFVLVDDSGALLAVGKPTGNLPPQRERVQNYQIVRGSKYATSAEEVGLAGSPGSNITRAS